MTVNSGGRGKRIITSSRLVQFTEFQARLDYHNTLPQTHTHTHTLFSSVWEIQSTAPVSQLKCQTPGAYKRDHTETKPENKPRASSPNNSLLGELFWETNLPFLGQNLPNDFLEHPPFKSPKHGTKLLTQGPLWAKTETILNHSKN